MVRRRARAIAAQRYVDDEVVVISQFRGGSLRLASCVCVCAARLDLARLAE